MNNDDWRECYTCNAPMDEDGAKEHEIECAGCRKGKGITDRMSPLEEIAFWKGAILIMEQWKVEGTDELAEHGRRVIEANRKILEVGR